MDLAETYRNADEAERKLIVDGLPYETGFMKPPHEHRFKPGNKLGRGRKSGSRNLRTQLKDTLRKKVPVQENGRKTKVESSEAMFMQLRAKAVQGNMDAIDKLIELARKTGLFAEESNDTPVPLVTAEDIRVISDLVTTIKGAVPSESDEDEGQ